MPLIPRSGFPPPPFPPLCLAESAFRVGSTFAVAATNVGATEVSDVGHLDGYVGTGVGQVLTPPP